MKHSSNYRGLFDSVGERNFDQMAHRFVSNSIDLLETVDATLLEAKFHRSRRSTGLASYEAEVMNDSSLRDKNGLIHTWLSIRKPGGESEYFGFGKDGKIETAADLKNRKPTESYKETITREQYDTIRNSIDVFQESSPQYSVMPNGDEQYNCVTAVDTLLQSAGIKFLEGKQSPTALWIISIELMILLAKCVKIYHIRLSLCLIVMKS
jgi:hypothetical protein